MLSLIKKDFQLTYKWIFFAAVYGIVMAYVGLSEASGMRDYLMFLVPFFVVMFPLGKLMNLEDNQDTRDFVKRIPISVPKKVLARTVYILTLIIVSMVCVVGSLLYKGMYTLSRESLTLGIAVLFGFLLYFLFQMTLFYFFSYHIAQMSVMFVLFGGMILAFVTGKLGLNISLPSMNAQTLIAILLPTDVVMYLAACKGLKV